jgi:hypothetical protein
MFPNGTESNNRIESEQIRVRSLTRSELPTTSRITSRSPIRRTLLSQSTNLKSSALSAAAAAAVHASLLRQFESAAGRFVARLDRAWSTVAATRGDLSSVVDELSAIDARVDGVQTTLRGELADGIEELEVEQAVNTYLERVIDKLIRYGRSIRLVAYYIDPVTGKHYRPELNKHQQQQQPQSQHHEAASAGTGKCPFEHVRRQGNQYTVCCCCCCYRYFING